MLMTLPRISTGVTAGLGAGLGVGATIATRWPVISTTPPVPALTLALIKTLCPAKSVKLEISLTFPPAGTAPPPVVSIGARTFSEPAIGEGAGEGVGGAGGRGAPAVRNTPPPWVVIELLTLIDPPASALKPMPALAMTTAAL